LGSRQGILKAKSEIFENLRPGGTAVLNGDDALLNTLELPFPTLRCGKSEHCGARVTDITDRGVSGITCTVTTARGSYVLSIPAPGEHMVYSASIAVAVGEQLGLTAEEIVRGVASYEASGSRMRIVRLTEGRTILDDCYNANPQSVTAALEILAKTDCDRKIAVSG
jgi:UDP-N-acetylmuramoyl-tripeptide--D-alanyl-D-alanine ligase